MNLRYQKFVFSARKEFRGIIFFIVTGAIVAGAIYLHWAASLTLPVPWGDEALFVWQARAFERWNTFIAPELRSDAPVFFLPFVYQTILGTVFKVLGYSLEIARYVSLAFVLIGFGFLAVLVRRHATPLAALVLVGIFLLSKYFIVMGNVSRMEAFLFAAICGVLLLWQRGARWTALAVLSVTPMIHPNGMYFLIPVAVYAVLDGGLFRERPRRVAVAMFLVSVIVWSANGIYALIYWDSFLYDAAWRLGETSSGYRGLSQFGGWGAVLFGLFCGTAALGAWCRAPIGYLLIIAVGAWLSNHVRIEQWYEPFDDLAYLLVSLALLEIAAHELVAAQPFGRRYRSMALGLIATGLVALPLLSGRLDGPRSYLGDIEIEVAGMRVGSGVTYFEAGDRKAIQGAVESLKGDCPVSVEVYPWGDALLIAELEDKNRVHFQVPFFDPFFQPGSRWLWGYHATLAPLPDLYLVRVSRYHPAWLEERKDRYIAHAGSRAGSASSVVAARDGTEIWYAIRPSSESRPAGVPIAGHGC